MILFLARMVALDKLTKYLPHIAGGLVLMLLFGAPILGLQAQAWAPFWFSGQHAAVVVSGPTPVPGSGPVATPIPVIGGPSTSVVAQVIASAMQWIGTPYLWGGCTRRGVDCSCFVLNAWAVAGVHLPRTTSEQVRAVFFVPREQVQAGDLVFFNNTCTECGPNPTHVGLAINASQMVEAGDPVQVAPINTGFYGSHYASAGRVTR